MLRPNCKDCTERYPGCHDKCESYKKYRKDYEKEKEIHRKAVEQEDFFCYLTNRGKRRKR